MEEINRWQRVWKVVYIFISFFFCIIIIEITISKFRGILPPPLKKVLSRRLNIKRYAETEMSLCIADNLLEHRYKPGLDIYVEGHPDFSYRVKTINFGKEDIGFRDDGLDSPPFAVAIGDSFTWGVGVNGGEIWVERLEKMLGKDVFNMGYSYRFGSLQELRLFERYGLRLKPRLVLWQFFLNDYYENIKFLEWEESGMDFKQWREFLREKNMPRNRKKFLGIRKFLEENSFFYRLGKWLIKKKLLHDYSYLEPLGIKFSSGQIDYVFHGWIFREGDLALPQITRGCFLSQEAIQQAYELCKKIDATLVVVVVPAKEQAAWKFAGPLLLGDKAKEVDIDRPVRIIKDFCKKNYIPCLDLTSYFREKTEEGIQLYFREDGHWNKKGHALAAELVYRFLISEGLI